MDTKGTESALFVGLDAGGTKTELFAATPGARGPVRLTGPGAQLQRQGAAEAVRVLSSLLERAEREHGITEIEALCAGVAGAGRPADRATLEEALRAALGRRVARVLVTDDAEIALEGAFEDAAGLLVLAGTGSIVVGRTAGGVYVRAGGWGSLLGDEGSGYRLGQGGLRAAAHALDGGPPTRLMTLLAQDAGIDGRDALIRRVYREGWPLQDAAPLVLRAADEGDGVARELLAMETDTLAHQARYLAERYEWPDHCLMLAGGLGGVPVYREAFAAAMRRHLPRWRLGEPRAAPVVGAWRRARRAAESAALWQ